MKKNKSTTKSTRRTNPLVRNTKIGPPRNRINFDGQIFRGIFHAPSVNTNATNTFLAVYSIDCGSGANAAASNFSGMLNFYKEYKYHSVTFEWVPSVAPGVADGGSEILIGFDWNPEQIASYQAGSGVPGPQLGVLRNDRSVKSFNAWERFTYNVPLQSRRKTFDVDVNPVGYLTDVNQIDRAVQGAVVVGYQSVNALASLGHFIVRPVIELRGLGNKAT